MPGCRPETATGRWQKPEEGQQERQMAGAHDGGGDAGGGETATLHLGIAAPSAV